MREIHRGAHFYRQTQTDSGRGRDMHAYTDGETGTDSSRQQQLSADRELHRLPAADRDSQRERQAAAERERLTETGRNRYRGRDTYS